jgi:hypothetical protein
MVCWLDRPMPYGLHRKQIYCLVDNVWTCAKQKPLLKPFVLYYYNIILLY